MPKETIMSKISNEDFELLVKESFSIKEVATKCGYSNISGASSNIVKKRIQEQGIDISHFQRPERIIRNDEEIFVEDSPVNQATLRRRYFLGEYTPYICSICGQEPLWQGKELTLILDHINGHNHDDRLENLRWVCPNCNQQLDTFSGRNRRAERKHNFCIDCGKEILLSSTRCFECSAKEKGLKQRKIERPQREILKSYIRSMPFTKIGEMFSVSDNAIRKWCDEYNLPRTKKEISKISDIDWEAL